MSSAMNRVYKLIALAVNKSAATEEARTAALKAVELISKDNLLSSRDDSVERTLRYELSTARAANLALRLEMDKLRQVANRSSPAAGAQKQDWKLITAKFDSCCGVCRESVSAGAHIYWQKGRGVVHVHCYPKVKK